MNCKQGDLAVIVRSYAGNEGKIVRCLRLLKGAVQRAPDGSLHCGDAWEVDCLLKGCRGKYGRIIMDEQMRPIRDNDGEDEMLRIAGLPRKENADA